MSEDREALLAAVSESMRGISQVFHRRFRDTSYPDIFDLTMPQCRIVLFLAEGPTHMTRIASSLGIAMPSATGVVDRLVERGLVHRTEDPDDRRHVICSLTKLGMDMATSLYEADVEILNSLLSPLTAEELGVILKGMKLLLRSAVQQGEQIKALQSNATSTLS